LPVRSLFALALAGCAQIGPKTVTVDRFDYSTAIADSWKQQTLLNIVKLRYMDLPVFVDVASIVSGYSMETSGNIGAQMSSANAVQGNSLLLGAAGKFTDRPTITYVPLTGEKFLRGFLAPIDPEAHLLMLQSGYAADFILGLSVESLNGVRNRSANRGRGAGVQTGLQPRAGYCAKYRRRARWNARGTGARQRSDGRAVLPRTT
jgi:hypothetical protein